jgi:hypothetical protein
MDVMIARHARTISAVNVLDSFPRERFIIVIMEYGTAEVKHSRYVLTVMLSVI